LLVNKDLIGDIKIEGYKDLLNPALKGKIAMGDPSNSSSAFAQLTNILLAMGGDYTNAAGWDYVKNLLAILNRKILNSSSAVHKGVADGEYIVGLTYEDPSAAYVRDGAPVEVIYMKEGVVYLSPGAAILKGAKNIENAKKFMDFLTSKKAQDIIGTKLTVRPVRADAKLGSYMKPIDQIKVIQEDVIYVQQHKNEIVEKYKAIFTK
jgi:iron(III) transport system substrate-binding protein